MKRGTTAGCVVIACALASSSTAASPSSSPKPRVALLAVPGDGAIALRARVRDRLAALGAVQPLDDDVLRTRLRGPAGVPLEVATIRARIVAADEAFRALDHERSVGLLESAIEALEADRDFSVEKQELLEQARLTCAQRLVGLAGPDETGKSETKNGQRARVHLARVLRSNPTFALDAKRYPPKMRALLALATDDVKQAGMGSLLVRSTEPGAVVRVDGRHIGSTPLSLHEGLAAGRFRLWLEQGERRSFTRVIDVVAGAEVPVEVDVAFEAALRADDLAVRPSRPFSPADWQRAAGLLDVDVIDLVGVVPAAGTTSTTTASSASSTPLVAWAAVVDGHTGTVLRGVRMPIGSTSSTSSTSPASTGDGAVDDRVVALFAGGAGDGGFVAPVDVFGSAGSAATAAATRPTSAEASVVEGEGFPWLGVGIGVGVGVAVAATAAVVLQATKTTTETFSVTVTEPAR